MNKLEQKDVIIETLAEAIIRKDLTIANYQLTVQNLERVVNEYEQKLKDKK